jgi:hypothetical protein
MAHLANKYFNDISHADVANTKCERSAHTAGQTPDEMYFGTAVDLPTKLAAARSNARAERPAANRAMTCNQCSGQQASPPMVPNPP